MEYFILYTETDIKSMDQYANFRHGIKNQFQAQVGVIYLDFINMYLRN